MSIIMPTTNNYKRNKSTDWSFSDNVLPNANFFDMSIRCGGQVVSSSIEEGSFFSYNKTTEPIEINATISFSGTNTFLQSVLDRLNNLKNAVTTFSIKTPVYEYQNMNLQNYDYDFRREDGLGVLYIKTTFIEIREVNLQYTNTTITPQQTKDVSASSTEDGGLKQTEEPSTEQYSAGQSSAGNISNHKRQSIAYKVFKKG